MENIKEKVERMKAKAELFLAKDIKVFIIDTLDNYYWCDILLVGEDYLFVQHFTGKKEGEKERILWYDIIKFEEYRKEKGVEQNE